MGGRGQGAGGRGQAAGGARQERPRSPPAPPQVAASAARKWSGHPAPPRWGRRAPGAARQRGEAAAPAALHITITLPAPPPPLAAAGARGDGGAGPGGARPARGHRLHGRRGGAAAGPVRGHERGRAGGGALQVGWRAGCGCWGCQGGQLLLEGGGWHLEGWVHRWAAAALVPRLRVGAGLHLAGSVLAGAAGLEGRVKRVRTRPPPGPAGGSSRLAPGATCCASRPRIRPSMRCCIRPP
jgi:hypothetical protein